MCVPTLRGNTAKVDSKGRIVLPKEMREGFGITPGTEVGIREEPYLFDVGVTALAHSDALVDDDFEAVRGITAEMILSPGQFETLNDYLGYRTRGSPR